MPGVEMIPAVINAPTFQLDAHEIQNLLANELNIVLIQLDEQVMRKITKKRSTRPQSQLMDQCHSKRSEMWNDLCSLDQDILIADVNQPDSNDTQVPLIFTC